MHQNVDSIVEKIATTPKNGPRCCGKNVDKKGITLLKENELSTVTKTQ